MVNDLHSKLDSLFSDLNEGLRISSLEKKLRLAKFFKDLKPKIDAYLREKISLDLVDPRDFNLFLVIKHDENRLSDVIRELLDPKGKHGQSTIFLESFLLMVGVGRKANLSNATIDRERLTINQRRLDLLIDLGDLGIGIENKPYAADLDEQIKTYVTFLRKKYGGNFRMLYLSGDGQGPEEHSISQLDWQYLLDSRQARLFCYKNDLKLWLEDCLIKCKANKIKWFLSDFLDFIDMRFS